jgi:WD40 repeat protein
MTGLVLLRSASESKECYSFDHVTLNHAGTFAGVRQNQNWGIRVWNLLDNTWDSHTDHSFATQDIVFTNDDQYVAALSMYGVVFLWDMKGNEVLRTNSDPEGYYDLGNNYCLAISNDSELFAIAGAEIHVGPLREESEPRRLSIPVDNYPTARAIAISQNADLIALGVDSDEISILLLDIKRGSLLATLNGHTNFIIRIWFSPDGSILTDASSDGTILLWGLD